MKKQNETCEAALCASVIDDWSARVRAFLSGLGLAKRDTLRYSMTVEEILLKTMESAGEGTPVTLTVGTRFFRPFISVETAGKANNVYAHESSERGVLGDGILKNLGLSPEYSYTNDTNTYLFRVKKKSLNPFISLLLTLAAAAAVGFLGLLLPEGFRTAANEYVLTPLHDVFLNILGCIAGPMVFLSVAWGIYGIGDAATFKRIGKRMLLTYILTVFAVIVIVGWLCVPFFSLRYEGGAGSVSELYTIITMILGIFPENIFSPFVSGNTLQIIFLAIVIGVALLFLGQKTNAVARAVEQINYIVQFLIEFISRLVPYFVFIVLLGMIWSDTAAILLSVGKLFIVFIAAVCIMAAVILLYTSAKNRVPVSLLVSKGLPAFLIAVTTASSAAAFGTNMNTCRTQYGIDDKITSFGLPLGMVTFKPTTALNYFVVTLFFAEIYDIQVSAAWVILTMFTVGILALATPPIPGGALTAYTVLFAQLGIPPEALAIALACDTLFDFVDTGFDQFLLPLTLLNQADRLGMVDRDTLRRRK